LLAPYAEVAANAEHYYRVKVRGNREYWNIRDHHMADTIDRLARHYGAGIEGPDLETQHPYRRARAYRHCPRGVYQVGRLIRERHRCDGVALIGLASHRGSVLAADARGPECVAGPWPPRSDVRSDLSGPSASG